MNGMDEIQPQEVIEGTEAVEAVEEQALDDATYDASAYVEASGDYEQSDEVETTFTEVVDSIVEPVEQQEQASQASTGETGQAGTTEQALVEESKLTQDIDPVTGQSKPSGGETGEKSDEEETPLEASQDSAETADGTYADAVYGQEEIDDAQGQGDDAMAKPDGTEGEDAISDTDGAAGTQIADIEKPAGFVDDKDVGVDQVGVPQIDRQLPEEKILAAGMGKHGLIPGGSQGKGMPGGSKGTSGGGPPVGNYGPGSKGKGRESKGGGKVTYWGVNDGDHFEGSSNDSCERETVKQSKRSEIASDGNVIIDCGDGTQYQLYWENSGPIEVSKRGYTFDGSQPMPYTGMWSSGPTDLSHKPTEGPDREASFLQMAGAMGGKVDTKTHLYGYGSTGSTTFSPSGGGDEDDSGKFHGGLLGGPARPNNPDDPDYYTPNVL